MRKGIEINYIITIIPPNKNDLLLKLLIGRAIGYKIYSY